ncbi:zinc-ribbon domain-containing protein [Nocardioides jensenii]|uniref:zinc-ribbon domain-containing protein n=1 Tax=Nocardioides jensenii TaxID=1843 RepID=UPI00082F6891|nr:hypothetical protein [Nocardioides jensenii]
MKFCPQCGTPTSPGHAFCGSCGSPLAAPGATGGEAAAEELTTTVIRDPQPSPFAPPRQPEGGAPSTPWQGAPTPEPAPTHAPSPWGTHPQPAAFPPQGWAPSPGPHGSGLAPTGRAPASHVPGQPAPAGPGGSIDFRQLLVGNWVAAFLTAFFALFLAFGLSAGLIWMGDPPETGTKDRLVHSAVAAAATVSVDATGSLEYDGGEIHGHGGTVPLTVALISLGGAAWLFRRMTRSYPTVGHALGDAVRAGLLYAVMLMVLAISLRGNEDSDLAEEMFGDGDDGSVDWGATVASSFFLGLLVVTVVLGLACLVRRDWLGPRLRRAHDVVAGPLRGVAAYLLLLPVAGGIANLAFWFTANNDATDTDGADANQVAAVVIGSLGNVGALFQSLGSGARIGASWDSREWEGDRGAEWHRLNWVIDQGDAWGGWFAIPTLLLVLIVSAYVVLRGGRATGRPMTNLLVWAGAMLVVSPVLSRVASVRGSGSGDGGDGESFSAEGYAGVKPSDYLLIPLIALLVALVVGALTGAFDVRALASRMQQHPAGAGVQQSGEWRGQPQSFAAPAAQSSAYAGPPTGEDHNATRLRTDPLHDDEPPTQWGQSVEPPR